MISRRHLLAPILIAVVAVVVLVGAVSAAIYVAAHKTDATKTPAKFEVTLPATKSGFQSLDSHIIGGSLNVSGQLQTDSLQVAGTVAAGSIAVSGAASASSLTLSPSDPSTHTAGQLYVSTDGSLNYYNGTKAVNIGAPALSANNAVLSLQGQTGSVSLTGGTGIAINGTTITNNGVTTFGGVTGSVALGTGLELVGNTLTSNALRSATSLSSDILVATDVNGNLTISSNGSGLGGRIALAPATAQSDPSNAASININKTGVGNLIQLSTGTTPVNRFVVDQSGAITSGSINFSQVTGIPSMVNSIGGVSGAVTLGSGLVMVGGQLSATATGGVSSISGTTDQVIVSGGSNAVLSLPQSIAVSSTPTFGGLTLSSALAVTSGGTGATNANGARTNLGAAASGSNNDITQLSGLTTALSVAQGGTGVAGLAQNGVVIGQGSAGLVSVVAAGAGQCLVSTAGTPSFQVCPGAGGVSSLNGATGALTLTAVNPTSLVTVGNTITIQDATSTVKGLASFSSTNLTVTSGVVNTAQDITVSATPTFAGLTLSSALSVASGGTGLGSTPLAGQLLIGNGSGYSLATLTAGAGITVTSGAGGITIAAPGSGSCPSCANQALSNLSGVALNTSLLPGTTNAIDLGSVGAAFRNGYIAGVMQVGSLDTASAAALTIGAANATAINLNQNTTLAAGNSLTVSGGATGTRPASPTAGMVYYDSTTNQLLQYNGTKWVGDHSTSTKIVAASNSSQAAKDAADYVATGTGDQTTINTALTAASGGLVYLMEGTYKISASISIPNNTSLTGAGAGSLITIPNANNASLKMIINSDTTTGTGISISGIRIDGNSSNQTSGALTGIYLSGMGSPTAPRDGAKISNIKINNLYNGSDGIDLMNGTSNSTVTSSYIGSFGSVAVDLFGFGSNNIISNNEFVSGGYGVYLAAPNNVVSNNTTYSVQYGVYIGTGKNVVSGNNFQGGATGSYGVYLNTFDASITNNVIQGVSAAGIYVSSAASSTISGNKITDSGGNTLNNGIYVTSSSSNSITNNYVADSSCTTSCYAINIFNSASASNYLADNSYVGTAANPATINDAGTGTVYANQLDASGNLINKSQGGGFAVGSTAATASLSLQGGLASSALPTPAAPTVATSGTAGTTTYGYRVSALDGLGETLASTETTIATGNATLTGTNKINITWAPVGGAYQYKIYRSTSNGTPATTGLVATVAGNVTTLSDTGLAASGVVAAANTTGSANFAGMLQGASLSTSGTSSLVGAVTLGAASATTGQLKLANAASAFVGTLQVASLSQNTTYTLPVSSAASDTICLLTLANCASGVSAVGALDGGTANANGATISGSTMYLQSASANFAGLVNTGTQTFAGAKTFNGSVTVAASQSLTLVGGNTASRPASPTAGMLYYDTTTNQMLQYNGGKWVGDHSTSTKIVAASNSTQAAKDAADYVATGTGDQATINTALTAAAGGTVYLMEGTYSETAAISIPNNTTLAGAGAGTLITIPNAQNSSYNVITNTDAVTGTHVTVKDLQIDGNKANQTSSYLYGIYMNNVGAGSGSTARDGARIINVIVKNIYNGIVFDYSPNGMISGSTILNSSNFGIYANYSPQMTMTGNTMQGNAAGTQMSYSSSSVVTGNLFQGSTNYGMVIYNSSITFTGNTISDSNYMGLDLYTAPRNTISGNVIQNIKSYGIYADSGSTNNVINDNKIHDTGGAGDNNGIVINAASQNSVVGNNITDSSCTSTCYAISILSNAPSNYLSNNVHSGSTANASSISDAAKGTIYSNQPDGSGNLINKSQGGGLAVGASAATASLTLQGGLMSTALPTPAAPTLSTSGTAGTTTYGYKVSALDGLGETLASTETTIATGNATLTSTNKINITWAPVGGAYQYKVYRSTAGGTPASTGLIGTVAGNLSTFSDTGIAASGAVAASNNTGGASIAGLLQANGSLTVTGSAAASVSVLTPLLDTNTATALNIGTTNASVINLNQNTTLAAGKSLTVTGGNTASRPASPTAGMLYYDTTTNQMLQYNGGKWVGDHSTSTKIVAASNSTQAAKDAADYVATGTGDQATINTALTAAAGGTVYLMEGTYSETAAISIPNNTTLAGAGAGTLITIPNAQNGSYKIITNTDTSTGTHVNVRDLQIDGNKVNQSSGQMLGIYFNNMGAGSGSSARDGGRIANVIVKNLNESGGSISDGGIVLNSSYNNVVTGNTALNAGNNGISTAGGSSYNTITGNLTQGNAAAGILLYGGVSNTVTGNTSQGNSSGFQTDFSASNSTFTGNTASGNTTYGFYINNGSSANVISGNKIHDSGGSSTNNGIYLASGSPNNSFTNNDITDSSCTSNCYAIKINDAASSGNYLSNNHHSGTAANPSTISDAGTGTIYSNQPDASGNLINKSQGGGLTVGASAASASLTLQGGLMSTALSTPGAATLTTSGTAGTTTYGYRVSAVDGLGETLASTETTIATGNATLSATNKINITWVPVGGAYRYKIYRSTSSGTPSTTGLIATVAGNVSTISDTGLAASGAVAAANTTGGASFSGAIQGSSATLSGTLTVTGATSLGQLTGTGAALFKNTADSTTAFQIQKSDASVLFAADTTNMTITIAKLIVTGDITVNGHIVTGGSAPTIAAGAAACTSPALSISGNDSAGQLTLTTGTGCSAAGTMATITFNKVFGTAPRVIFTPTTAASAGLGIYNGAASTTTFTIDTSATPVDATTYTFNYVTIQ